MSTIKHLISIIIKFAMIAVVLELVLGVMTNLTFRDILLIALAVTGLAYLIGDLMILPASNNTMATIGDIGLAAVTIWLFNFVFDYAEISVTDALAAAVVIGLGEWIFHKFIHRAVLPGPPSGK